MDLSLCHTVLQMRLQGTVLPSFNCVCNLAANFNRKQLESQQIRVICLVSAQRQIPAMKT